MQNKKLAWARIAIFTILAFLIFWIPIWIFDTNIAVSTDPKVAFVAIFAGFSPAIANILTRLLTKEGFSDSFLHFRFTQKGRYYLIAPLLNIVYVVIPALFVRCILSNRMTNTSILDGTSTFSLVCGLFSNLGYACIFALYTFGEEFGWRAYLMPRLEKLIGTAPSIFVGGIIWGLWHAPLFIYGYNFGSDYPFFPYLGIALMCVTCIASNSIYTWLTKRSGSIFPSSLAHASNNSVCNLLTVLILFGKLNESDIFLASALATGFEILIALPFFISCCKKIEYDMP